MEGHQKKSGMGKGDAAHWKRLALMTALSFAAMYALMYMMVDKLANVQMSLNQVYMAGMMAAAMVIIELAVMGAMYPAGRTKNAVLVGSGIALVLLILFTRKQVAITERDFLRSMISHHASALLMCEQNRDIRDPEINELCRVILESQQEQIDFMKTKL